MDNECKRIIRENYKIKTRTWLSKKTGYCTRTIINFLKSENLFKNKSPKISEVTKEYILKNPENLTQKELAEKLNISYGSVNRIRIENGIRIYSK